MKTMLKKRLVLKEPYYTIFRIIGFILLVLIGLFIFYRYEMNSLLKLNYSEEASKNILFSFKKKEVLAIGKNKTLNAAFESDYYNEKYFDRYSKIDYQKQDNLIRNINTFIKKKYTNSEISIILAHGNDKDVTEFSKRDKVRYVEEFFSYDFAKLSLYDRYVKYSNESGDDEETTVIYVNLDMDKVPYEEANEVKEFSTTMLVNKHFYIDEKFVPQELVKINKKYSSEDDMQLNREAYNAFLEMYNAASKENLGLVINSAYRSYQDQVEINDFYLKHYGQNYVDKYVAKPGFSEHQTGLCFDIGSTTSNVFAKSNEYPWMLENAYKYGFIQRFSSEYEDLTGFRAESWHFRYVGKKIAKEIHDNNMSFEEYYARNLMK